MVRWLFSHLNIGLPEDLHDRIKKHPEIRWASIARELLTQYLDEYEKFKESQFKKIFKEGKEQQTI